jgi:outer membrane murein-binding lipoprotein Lpp
MTNNNGRANLNTNTFVSLGVLAAIVTGTWVLANKISGVKTDILASNVTMKAEFSAKATSIEARVTALEGRPKNESWSDGDMFRWATRLQRENRGLKVPEPPMKSDTAPPR